MHRQFGWLKLARNQVLSQLRSGHADRRQTRQGRRRCQPSNPTDIVENCIQGLTLDELHGVIKNALVFADAEDGHDVRMVKLGRGPGLPLKSFAKDRSG